LHTGKVIAQFYMEGTALTMYAKTP